MTSAMCTPTSLWPFGRVRMCRASSMSLHPGGSTLQMARCRKSSLRVRCVVLTLEAEKWDEVVCAGRTRQFTSLALT